jgi:tRNA 2-selenouridine synthase
MRWLAESVRKKAKGGTALIHCWRGGMRSESVAWLVEYTGVKTVILEKGYKAYRTWCIERFNEERKIVILSGRTGSGKTEILSHLKNIGEQMIDLEGIAHHKGSAFGSLGELPQPPQEHFENVLAWQLSQTSPSRRLWLEDESLHVGRCVIPDALWPKMRTAPVVVADIPFERRVDYLLQSYGTFDPYQLTLSTRKIEKRFGPERTKECLSAIESGDIRTAISISLDYYDRTYDHGLSKRVNPVIFRHAVDDAQSLADIAAALVRLADENNLT